MAKRIRKNHYRKMAFLNQNSGGTREVPRKDLIGLDYHALLAAHAGLVPTNADKNIFIDDYADKWVKWKYGFVPAVALPAKQEILQLKAELTRKKSECNKQKEELVAIKSERDNHKKELEETKAELDLCRENLFLAEKKTADLKKSPVKNEIYRESLSKIRIVLHDKNKTAREKITQLDDLVKRERIILPKENSEAA